MLLHFLFLETVIATHDIRFKMAPTKYLTTHTVKLFILLNGERIWTWPAQVWWQDTHEAQYSSVDRYHFTVIHCIPWGQRQCTPLHNVGTYLHRGSALPSVMLAPICTEAVHTPP